VHTFVWKVGCSRCCALNAWCLLKLGLLKILKEARFYQKYTFAPGMEGEEFLHFPQCNSRQVLPCSNSGMADSRNIRFLNFCIADTPSKPAFAFAD
jgi:hypothetical protein